MDFSDRIRSYQSKVIYSDLINRSAQLGLNCHLFASCVSTGCKINFQTFELREQVRQGRAECTGSNTFLAAYVGPKLLNLALEPEPEPEPEPEIDFALATFTVTTLAGSGLNTFADSTGVDASFNAPRGIDILPNGNVIIADSDNNRIRLLRLSDSNVSTIAGSNADFADDTGTNALFNFPVDIATLLDGNIVITDSVNNRIRLLRLSDSNVTTIAGGTSTGFADGIGTDARFNSPEGIAVLSNGNIIIVDANTCVIRLLRLSDSNVTTIAGSAISGFSDGFGTNALFNFPRGVAVLSNGNIVIADTQNNRIRLLTLHNSNVTTIAGGEAGFADGIGSNARFDTPSGLAVLPNDNIIIADTNNNRIRLLRLSDSNVTTIAGSNSGFANGIGTNGLFVAPEGIAVLPNNNIIVGDTGNHRIRLITISI